MEIYYLSDEILVHILSYFDEKQLAKVSRVCKRLWAVANDRSLLLAQARACRNLSFVPKRHMTFAHQIWSLSEVLKNRIAVGTTGGWVHIINLDTAETKCSKQLDGGYINAVTWVDHDTVAAQGRDGRLVKKWNFKSNAIAQLGPLNFGTQAALASKDGIVYVGDEGRIRTFDPACTYPTTSRNLIHQIGVTEDGVMAIDNINMLWVWNKKGDRSLKLSYHVRGTQCGFGPLIIHHNIVTLLKKKLLCQYDLAKRELTVLMPALTVQDGDSMHSVTIAGSRYVLFPHRTETGMHLARHANPLVVSEFAMGSTFTVWQEGPILKLIIANDNRLSLLVVSPPKQGEAL